MTEKNAIDAFLDPDEKVDVLDTVKIAAPGDDLTDEQKDELLAAFRYGFNDEGNAGGLLEIGAIVKKKPEEP